jgi:hypothetical protein
MARKAAPRLPRERAVDEIIERVGLVMQGNPSSPWRGAV